MLIKLLKLLIRLLIFPISSSVLILTMLIELAYSNPNWKDWEKFNKGLIELLPWKPL